MNIHRRIFELLGDLDGCIFFEIGAHYCEDSEKILPLLKRPAYYVVEPDPRNTQEIKKRDIFNHITLFEIAIGSEDGETEMYLSTGNANKGHPDWTGSSSIKKPKKHLNEFPWCKFDSKVVVPVKRLDTIFDVCRLDRIDFVWADTQGAEVDVVTGGQNALKHTKYLYSEYYDDEIYEGQVPLKEWITLLPGNWSIIEKYPNDVLLQNLDYVPRN